MTGLTKESRIRGCLLGGAIGDALGGPVEFMSGDEIEERFGRGGVRTFQPMVAGGFEQTGLITDDTQMTLFTIEGIIRATNRMNQRCIGFTNAVIHHAYLRWADTQMHATPVAKDGWLIGQQWLYSRRAPGLTCLSALDGGTKAVERFGEYAVNDSKGCGGVMRSAPFGWLSNRDNYDWIYGQACEAAAYTHGHPTGQVASGALAFLIARIMDGEELLRALQSTTDFLREQENHVETLDALGKGIQLSMHGAISRQDLETLGGGWIAEEALAIGVYAALSYPDRDQAVDALALAVSHGGDSDSTGSICGNILGALHGETWLPAELAFQVEGRGTMLELADDFIYAVRDGATPKTEYMSAAEAEKLPDGLNDMKAWLDRYPGN
jgi:ADP-ribosylglycohydrolase